MKNITFFILILFSIQFLNSCKKQELIDTCNDGIKNENELAIDCGGSCTPCDPETLGYLIDERDGQKYNVVKIGEQLWMAENLNYQAPGSECYNKDLNMCDTLGRQYDLITLLAGESGSDLVPSGIQGVCPKGWHIPSVEEFNILFDELGGIELAGGKMKSVSSLWNTPNTSADNSSGFSALPAGFGGYDFPDNISGGKGVVTYFWTAYLIPPIGLGKWVELWSDRQEATVLHSTGNTWASCRCIQD